MPFILVTSTDVAAGSTTNPLIGSQYEYLSFAAFVEFAIYADTGDTFTLSVFSGSDLLMQNGTMPILATAVPIIVPDHYFLNDVIMPGERIGVSAVNGTGAVASFRTSVRITPL